MKNVTYIISNINKALAFEWVASYLDKSRFKLNFILLNPGDSDLEVFLRQSDIPVERITFMSKKDIPKAIFKIYKLLKKHKTHIVHTHLFEATVAGLTASWIARVPKRIHTRHHSNYHHVYYPKALKYDKLINFLSTDIVAISEVVRNILIKKENASSKKVHLIHHGFKLEEFENVPEPAVNNLKQKYIKHESYPVVGIISRYLNFKGIQYAIPAFEKLLKTHPNALLVLANAKGEYKSEIQKLLALIPEKNYVEITFEPDIFALYRLFDVFIHVPITYEVEAFGQTYIEALASGIPSVYTLSGIANEFIKDRSNALVVPHNNSDAIYNSIMELLENRALSEKITINGKKDVNPAFSLDKMMLSLKQLYER